MIIRWLGQASFSITTTDGTTVRTDPFDESLGLPVSKEPADVITVSHGHHDHNAVHLVPGEHEFVDQPGEHTAAGITFTGVLTSHDEHGGSKRGENVILCFEADGVRLCHLGDLGHVLTPGQVDAIGRADVLLIPVGGTYTIDHTQADEVIAQLNPRVIIPMHCKLPGMTLPIAEVKPFLEGKANVRRLDELDVTAETLPAECEVVVLSPPK